MSIQIPDFVQDRISQIKERTGISIDEITGSYLELFNDDFVQKDVQFQNDDERHRYANAVLWSMYVARQPVKEQVVVPIGMDGARTSRAGNLYSTIYAIAKGGKGIRRISCQGDAVYLYKQINLFYQYTTKLGEFRGGDFQADNRTKFERPVRLKLSPQQFMDRLNIKRIPDVISAKDHLSNTVKNRVDNSDWRVIRGIIARQPGSFTRDDGSEGAVYTLSDDSINGGEAVSDDGDVVAGLTTWTCPELAVWQQYDEVDAYGPLGINRKNKEPNLNAYLFIPIHARGGSS